MAIRFVGDTLVARPSWQGFVAAAVVIVDVAGDVAEFVVAVVAAAVENKDSLTEDDLSVVR